MSTVPETSPNPAPGATMALLAGLALTQAFARGETPVDLAHNYAVGIGLSIVISLALDYRRRLRNLIRADLMAFASLYFLTLFEFLLPQSEFNDLVSLDEIQPAVLACLIGFAGLAVGRHAAPRGSLDLQRILRRDFSTRTFLTIYTISLIAGYFYMLLAVDFDLGEMFHYFMMPRFSQPWGRGRLGDWKALIGELGMLLYLVPPIAGIVFARRREYTPGQSAYVALTFLFTLFYGFTSGTRNIFATYLATFLVAYAFAIDARKRRELIVVAGAAGAMMLTATVMMLEFRTIGFESYLGGFREVREAKKESNFFVDYNLYVIAKLTDVFPVKHEYLGMEIPYLALIRPIPRAIWSSKPEGMSFSIEDAVGVEGLTLASSFVGEAYMSGGIVGVFLTGFVFGMIAGWWNHFGHPNNSAFGHLIFASGFFAAVISMRSMFVFTTAVLPTVGALVLGHWLVGKYRKRSIPVEPST